MIRHLDSARHPCDYVEPSAAYGSTYCARSGAPVQEKPRRHSRQAESI